VDKSGTTFKRGSSTSTNVNTATGRPSTAYEGQLAANGTCAGASTNVNLATGTIFIAAANTNAHTANAAATGCAR
jgi:hypothetical protein